MLTPGPNGTLETAPGDPAGGDDEWITYDKLTKTGFTLPAMVADDNASNAVPTGVHHGQISLKRDGRFIRYICDNATANTAMVTRLPSTPGYSVATHSFTADDKGVTATLVPDNMQLRVADRRMYSLAEVLWMPILGLDNNNVLGALNEQFDQHLIGGSATTIPEWGGTLRTAASAPPGSLQWKLYLDFLADAPASTGLPHAAMILQQFTTLSPMHDQVDNDGDGFADESVLDTTDTNGDGIASDPAEAEHFVFGRHNINTMPLHLLALSAPLPDSIDNTQRLMESIINYRDDPTTRASLQPAMVTNLRRQAGIASIGELMLINPASIAPGDQPANMSRWGHDGAGQEGTALDLSPLDEDERPIASAAPEHIEEELARFQFLSQAFDVRSDIYSVYIVVRNNDDTIEKRAMVILDRSSVTNANDEVEIIGSFGF